MSLAEDLYWLEELKKLMEDVLAERRRLCDGLVGLERILNSFKYFDVSHLREIFDEIKADVEELRIRDKAEKVVEAIRQSIKSSNYFLRRPPPSVFNNYLRTMLYVIERHNKGLTKLIHKLAKDIYVSAENKVNYLKKLAEVSGTHKNISPELALLENKLNTLASNVKKLILLWTEPEVNELIRTIENNLAEIDQKTAELREMILSMSSPDNKALRVMEALRNSSHKDRTSFLTLIKDTSEKVGLTEEEALQELLKLEKVGYINIAAEIRLR